MLSPEEESELLTDRTIVPAKRAAKVMRGYLAQFEKLGQDGGAERAIRTCSACSTAPRMALPSMRCWRSTFQASRTSCFSRDRNTAPLPEARAQCTAA